MIRKIGGMDTELRRPFLMVLQIEINDCFECKM